MATEVALDRLQEWMQAFIVYPGSDEDALAAASEQIGASIEETEHYILPSKTLTPVERLDVYRGMYLLRMRDALAADYYAVLHFLGEDDFDALVARYVETFPSRSYNLNRLSDRFPEFIHQDDQLRHRAFLYDLARLELAIAQVFDSEPSRALKTEDIQAIPADAWADARLRPVTAFQVMAFRYPVNDYLQAVRNNTPRPKIRRQDSWLAVYQRDFSVWRFELTHPEYNLLQALASGKSLGDAIVETTQRFSRHGVKEQVFHWFRQWMTQEFFQAVELPS